MGQLLPKRYEHYLSEGAPKELVEALRHYGILEHPGQGSNPNILAWAKEIGVSGWYHDDDIPWCGLFRGVVAKRCGWPVPVDSLAAKSWLGWGTIIPIEQAMLWDTLIFSRPGGNHVAWYAGECDDKFLVYGGNQSNAVGFTFIPKSRCIGVRRAPWRISQPTNIRKVFVDFDGNISTNEQ